MSRNSGTFISRETNTYENGDRAITDTFQLDDGTLVFHVYNVTADGLEHSHQIMDEYGNHVYARAIGGEHPWIELDRMVAMRWLQTLTPEKLNRALQLVDMGTIETIINIASGDEIYIQANNLGNGKFL